MSRETRIADMRELLQFLEDNPIVPCPYFLPLNAFASDDDDVDVLARAMAPCDKRVDDSFFALTREFGLARLNINFSREDVCERIVVGTEDMPERLIEGYTRDIVEWKCPDRVLRQA